MTSANLPQIETRKFQNFQNCSNMPPRSDRNQQRDGTPPPPLPPQMPYERDSVDMLAGITKMLERQTERPGKSHEEYVAERFCSQLSPNQVSSVLPVAMHTYKKRQQPENSGEKQSQYNQQEGFTRRFDEYSSSAHTRSSSLAQSELLATPQTITQTQLQIYK
ncbi:hypothetical protein F511_31644 [Dorcoceras hygrometricum]|uniref:Uncharacterized protein n=1 Tax=Dorcoceras hygrometricum TaxID=472368 RepID=A0A2Z7DE68_9LAMI|nr:hypothetical protein F511_31644 [Dorcoceras hygrometricum]